MKQDHDIAIAGGGLAGLSASILLARAGHSVVLIEKEHYPFHRVCGEYVGMESYDFLQHQGLPLASMKLPRITKLLLTAPGGRSVKAGLEPGGFGISRYLLDKALADLAKSSGVQILEGTRVESINGTGPFSLDLLANKGEKFTLSATMCCAAWGKRSNMDLKWKRSFLIASSERLENFVGIKYHVRAAWPPDQIGLHNFENGYCGISAIEDGLNCLCYLTRARNLKTSGGQIEAMEKNILAQNPHLKNIFDNCERLPGFPVTISQISFSKKNQVENGVLMLGDSAGMITPLCGNGMSIALRTGKIAAGLVHDFLKGKMDRTQMEKQYAAEWNKAFAQRLWAGRKLQSLFGSKGRSNLLVNTVKIMPFLSQPLVRLTHGTTF